MRRLEWERRHLDWDICRREMKYDRDRHIPSASALVHGPLSVARAAHGPKSTYLHFLVGGPRDRKIKLKCAVERPSLATGRFAAGLVQV